MSGGGGNMGQTATRIEALQLQSSAYGVVWPVVGGMTRIPGNLIWYGDFKATAHTTEQSSGGKGGGGTMTNTDYTYSASVLMGVHQGVGAGVNRVWVGKKVYDGGWSASLVQTTDDVWTTAGSGTLTYTMAHGASLLGDPVLTLAGRFAAISGILAKGTDYTVSGSTITLINGMATAYGKVILVRYQWSSGAPDLSALQELGITYVPGSGTQTAPAWLAATHASEALAYRSLAYVHAQNYELGSGAQVENHLFEVIGPGAYRYGGTSPDCNPWEFSGEFLTNGRYGARMPAALLDTTQAITYTAAAGILMSPAITEQTSAADFISQMCALTNCGAVWSVDHFKIVPYGDTALTGNGVTYTPNTTPVYDLDDDSIICGSNEDPVDWLVKTPTDRYNVVRVEYLDRSNAYAKSVAEAKDEADIQTNGQRVKDTITAHWICDAAVANLVAWLTLQRSLHISGSGKFVLPWAYGLIEPMDLLTLTDSGLGMQQMPVRITEVDEDADGFLSVTVEDWPLGVASATQYPVQVPAGYQHDYNVAPGNIDAPVFFEAPVELTTTGLAVHAAVRGLSANWGGCDVYVSLDGSTYKRIQTINGASRYGTLSAAMTSGGTGLSVSGITGQLLNASAADASALTSLVYVGGSSPEYMAYTGATLTGAGAYTVAATARLRRRTPRARHSCAWTSPSPDLTTSRSTTSGGPSISSS